MFHRLKLYTIHTRPGGDATLERPLFLREGFNWFAFLFTFLWAFYHRLWRFGGAILLANLSLVLFSRTGLLGEATLPVVQFGLQIIVGFMANDALRARLRREGYLFQDIAGGDSLLAAEQRYFDRLVAAT